MADIPLHPSDMADDNTSLEATRAFFVKCGLMKEGDRFVVGDDAMNLDDADPEVRAGMNSCEENCAAAYELAILACSIFGSSSCKRKAKAAYNICVLACG